jgi:hypothetical protein
MFAEMTIVKVGTSAGRSLQIFTWYTFPVVPRTGKFSETGVTDSFFQGSVGQESCRFFQRLLGSFFRNL